MTSKNIKYEQTDLNAAREKGQALITIDVNCKYVPSGPLTLNPRVTLQGCCSVSQAERVVRLLRELVQELTHEPDEES